jgi:plastocyanin
VKNVRPAGVKLLLVVLSIAALLVLAACSTYSSSTTSTPSSTPTVSSPVGTGNSVTIGLTAKNIAFDKSTITVPAGAQVTINFDNQDSGIPHNFALYTDSSAKTSIFVGGKITGPKTTTYTFTAPATPGNYFFRCDVHPTQMKGTFVVQ